MQTRDQKLAGPIFEQVSEIAKRAEVERKKYGSMAHKLPVLIRTAGLAQALAFVEARGSEPQRLLLDHLAKIVLADNRTKTELLKESRDASLEKYMLLTQNTLAALLWYKRFAQSVLGVEQGSEIDPSERE